MLCEIGKLIIRQIISEGEGYQTAVSNVMSVECACSVFFVKLVNSKFWPNPFIDDFVGFDLSEVFDRWVIFAAGLEQVALVVVTYFLKVEDNLVVALVLNKNNAVTISDITTYPRLTDGDGVVGWYLLEETGAFFDLVLVKPRQ